MRTEVFILGLLILSLILIFSISFYEIGTLEEDAKKYVMEDARIKYPAADIIEIINMEKSFNEEEAEYYKITIRISENLESPCPTRIHLYYNYPEQNFVIDPPEKITKGCITCEGEGCVIAFEEEAIIASHTNKGSELVAEFLKEEPTAMPLVVKTGDGWMVSWIGEEREYDVYINIGGEISKVEMSQ
ncbi:hypothetical protein KAW38_01370 [Candidatus Micrarchaeota archaeon]|nr:hypothetical protein [Candidatus Micrarchaeota archaeon]